MKYKLNIALAACCYMTLLDSLTSCDKDPETITVTKIDTLIGIDTLTLIDTVFETLPDTATTFIMVANLKRSEFNLI